MPALALNLLKERDVNRRQQRLDIYDKTRKQLKHALAELIPGHKVIIFGSLTRPGIFNSSSDIDLALEIEPPQMSMYRLTAELIDRLERRVDIILLDRCRLRDKVRREGESWTA